MLKLTFITTLLFSMTSLSLGDQCQVFKDKYQELNEQGLAKKLYEQAFIHQLNGQWQEAQRASDCSSAIINGHNRWSIESSDLL